jgi:thiol:disulfide interchange protein DsbA
MLRVFGFLLLWLPLVCFAEAFEAGKDYELINPSAKTVPQNNKVTVTEFFSFGCPWCYRIEPALTQWQSLKNKEIKLKRIPVVFNKEWIYYAKAYYVADLLGIGAKADPLLFKAIQTDKKLLNNNQAMIDFFVSLGVNKEMAESAFIHSTTVDMKIQEGSVIMGRMRINAVPAFVVNHQYKTDLQMAKDEKRLFQIIDYLVSKSKKATA